MRNHQATCALRELLSVAETEVLVQNHYPRMLTVLLIRISACLGVAPGAKGAAGELLLLIMTYLYRLLF